MIACIRFHAPLDSVFCFSFHETLWPLFGVRGVFKDIIFIVLLKLMFLILPLDFTGTNTQAQLDLVIEFDPDHLTGSPDRDARPRNKSSGNRAK